VLLRGVGVLGTGGASLKKGYGRKGSPLLKRRNFLHFVSLEELFHHENVSHFNF
jgi:hypothetical protein